MGFLDGLVRFSHNGSRPPTQDLVPVEWVEEDGTIVLRGGRLALILEVEPVDLGRLDQGQQRAVIETYRDFLRWLPWDIQIVRMWEPQDLEPPLQLLEENAASYEGEEPGLARACRDWLWHLEELRMKLTPREKRIYLVVWVSLTPVQMGAARRVSISPATMARKREELWRRARMTVEKLGLEGRILNGDEVMKVLRHAYSPIGGSLVPETSCGTDWLVRSDVEEAADSAR